MNELLGFMTTLLALSLLAAAAADWGARETNRRRPVGIQRIEDRTRKSGDCLYAVGCDRCTAEAEASEHYGDAVARATAAGFVCTTAGVAILWRCPACLAKSCAV